MASRNENMITIVAGAFAGLAIVALTYIDGNKGIDGNAIELYESALMLIVAVLFFYFVGWKGTVEFWNGLWQSKVELSRASAQGTKRFLYFAAGLLLIFLPGILILFTLF